MGGCRVILLDLGGGRTHLQTCSSVIGIGKKTHTTHIHAHTHTHTCSSVISIGKRTHTTHVHPCTHSHACSSVTSTILSLSHLLIHLSETMHQAPCCLARLQSLVTVSRCHHWSLRRLWELLLITSGTTGLCPLNHSCLFLLYLFIYPGAL